jgi:hypothetical protein
MLVPMQRRYFTFKRILQILAVGLVLAAVSVVLFVPSYGSATETTGGVQTTEMVTAWEVNGPRILLLLVIPVALSLLPVFSRSPAWQLLSVLSAALLTTFAVITSLSIGWFFFPAAVIAIIAAFVPVRPRRKGALGDPSA